MNPTRLVFAREPFKRPRRSSAFAFGVPKVTGLPRQALKIFAGLDGMMGYLTGARSILCISPPKARLHTSLGQRPRLPAPDQGLKARPIADQGLKARPIAMPQSLDHVLLHLIFSTKDRFPWPWRIFASRAPRSSRNDRNVGCECPRAGAWRITFT